MVSYTTWSLYRITEIIFCAARLLQLRLCHSSMSQYALSILWILDHTIPILYCGLDPKGGFNHVRELSETLEAKPLMIPGVPREDQLERFLEEETLVHLALPTPPCVKQSRCQTKGAMSCAKCKSVAGKANDDTRTAGTCSTSTMTTESSGEWGGPRMFFFRFRSFY